jgi:hypothetical protein
MIIKAAALGLMLWSAIYALFLFFGPQFFLPSTQMQMILTVATPPVSALVTFGLLMVLREDPSDRAEGAVAMAFPGLLLSAFAAQNYQAMFPALDPLLGQNFGSLMLLAYATMIFTGLMMSRLTERDERL